VPLDGFAIAAGQDLDGCSNARVYKNCILTGIALQMAAQDMLIQEQVNIMFTYLDNKR
jgi:hypothetical protein